MSRFQFVADNSATFEVKRLCELVEIERSSYYAWRKAAPAREDRARADAELATRIRAVHAEDNTQGAPRITAELNDNAPAGARVNHKRVARVMRVTCQRDGTTVLPRAWDHLEMLLSIVSSGGGVNADAPALAV